MPLLTHVSVPANPRYCTMRDCWATNPLDRPSFSDLETRFGAMIGEANRQVMRAITYMFSDKFYCLVKMYRFQELSRGLFRLDMTPPPSHRKGKTGNSPQTLEMTVLKKMKAVNFNSNAKYCMEVLHIHKTYVTISIKCHLTVLSTGNYCHLQLALSCQLLLSG